jgi:adenylate cyclase
MSWAVLGQPERAKEWKDRAILLDPDNQFMRYNSAVAETLFFDNKDAALEALSLALTRGGANIATLAANDPNLDSLRDEPRFITMMKSAKERAARLAVPAALPLSGGQIG